MQKSGAAALPARHPGPDNPHLFKSDRLLAQTKGSVPFSLTARASAPEILVREVVERLNQLGISSVDNLEGAQEKVAFALPKGLG